MKTDEKKLLDELLEEALSEKKQIEKKYHKNLEQIKELDSFISSIVDTDGSDFKVFSPRTAESLHKEELEEARSEKEQLENRNDSYYKEITKFESRIEKINLLITQKKNYEKSVHLSLFDIQEKERSRIAKELHDSSLQNLAHLVHSIELGSLYIDQDPVRAKLEFTTCSQSLRQIIDEIRDTIFNLRPMTFDDLGLKHAIENYVDNVKTQYQDFYFSCDIDDVTVDDLVLENKEEKNFFLLSVYRVIQEAVQNIVKHSNGKNIQLILKNKEEKIVIKIIDDGIGFDPNKVEDKHFGISIMKERISLLNGVFEISSMLNQGTRIFISVPK